MTTTAEPAAPGTAPAISPAPPAAKPLKKPVNATIGDILCPLCLSVADVRRASTGNRKYYWYCACGMLTPNLAPGQDYILENARIWGDGERPEGKPARMWGRVVDPVKIRNGETLPRVIEGTATRIPDPEKPGKPAAKPESLPAPQPGIKPGIKPVAKPEPKPVKESAGFGFFK